MLVHASQCLGLPRDSFGLGENPTLQPRDLVAGAIELLGEAQARVAQRRAELLRLSDRVNFEVQEAAEQVREAEDIVRLYEMKVLPAAEANIKEAQTAYVNGKVPFLNTFKPWRTVSGLRDLI